jgi:hemerythrin-like domain-containing protein
MDDISSWMTRLRRDCEQHFSNAKAAASNRDWGTCQRHFQALVDGLEMHFCIEESLLFPAFDEETGGEFSDTRDMLIEHLRLRELIHRLSDAVFSENADSYHVYADTISGVLRHHNETEQCRLYPMIDDVLIEQRDALTAEITEMVEPV